MGTWLLFAVLCGCAGMRADVPPAQATPWREDHLACKRNGTFPVEAWGIAGLKVGENSLEDVRKRLGDADIVRPYKDEAAPKVLCYRLGRDGVAVFESGPMAPVDGEVTAISLLDPAYVPFVDRCAVPAHAEVAATPRDGRGSRMWSSAPRGRALRNLYATPWKPWTLVETLDNELGAVSRESLKRRPEPAP